jgi:hypothetical protein
MSRNPDHWKERWLQIQTGTKLQQRQRLVSLMIRSWFLLSSRPSVSIELNSCFQTRFHNVFWPISLKYMIISFSESQVQGLWKYMQRHGISEWISHITKDDFTFQPLVGKHTWDFSLTTGISCDEGLHLIHWDTDQINSYVRISILI